MTVPASDHPLKLIEVLDHDAIPAGDFRHWLAAMAAALDGSADMDVPCGTCTACCRSSQFVDVAPDEVEARAHIPAELLFPAPGRAGHHVLGYDDQGRCPMLGNDGCTIHPYRPRACRTYDCRVFAAAGLDPAAEGKPDIGARAARWRFEYPTEEDRRLRDAVRVSASQLAEDSGVDGRLPVTRLAVLAVRRWLR